jgi:hypothetical protein
MAQRPPAITCEDGPLDEARRLGHGPRMDPELYDAFTQNIPSLNASASNGQEHLRHSVGGSPWRGRHES